MTCHCDVGVESLGVIGEPITVHTNPKALSSIFRFKYFLYARSPKIFLHLYGWFACALLLGRRAANTEYRSHAMFTIVFVP
jgi:hypothetical protein